MCPPEAFLSADQSTHLLNLETIIPPTKVSKAAYEHASSILHPSILNHSVRVYLYTRALAASSKSKYHTESAKQDLLFVACLFHDIGTAEQYNGHHRFEVEGGDAAVKHLEKFGIDEEGMKEVWTTIALHTSRGIVERMGELPALFRKGLEIEFGIRTEVEEIENLKQVKARIEEKFARLDIEKVLSDLVVEQAVKNPAKAPPATWPGVLYQSHLENPDWKGVNKAFGP